MIFFLRKAKKTSYYVLAKITVFKLPVQKSAADRFLSFPLDRLVINAPKPANVSNISC